MAYKVHILPTHKTPEVLLDPAGIIKIKGRAIDESRTTQIPEKVMNWVESYFLNPPDQTEVIVALEFLNSFNTIILTAILKKISQTVPQGKRLIIHWYYEADDVDIFERGEYISSTINFPIEFSITENIANC